jgi:DedD protein
VDETPLRIVTRQPSMLSKLPSSGFTYQAGVFADQQRAEDVYAKLVLEGIPATLETRVLVGPFRNRNEAEAARVRMKELGIDALPIPRSGKK